LLLAAIEGGGWTYGGKQFGGRPDIYASVNLGHLKQLKAAGMNFSFPILPSQQRSSGQNPQSSGLLGDLKE